MNDKTEIKYTNCWTTSNVEVTYTIVNLEKDEDKISHLKIVVRDGKRVE